MAPLLMEAGSRPPSKVRELDGRVEFRKIDFIEQATGEKHAGKTLRRVVGSSFLEFFGYHVTFMFFRRKFLSCQLTPK